jgi:hypothetical protein
MGKCLAQDCFEVFSAHVLVAYANDPITRRCQKLATRAVINLSRWSIVHTPVELDNHAFAGAVKVNDEAVQHMLPAKLQTEYAPIAQQRPRMTFGGSGSAAQLTGEREPLRRAEATKRIHRARMTTNLHAAEPEFRVAGQKHAHTNSP